jgi:acyl carrier protein
VLGSASTAVLAARVANTYDFQGPALTINTACSSSLVAVDLALADLRRGRIDYAIVGGVNLLDRSGLVSQHLRKGNFLSPTNRCHTFSSSADGYVRGEGGVCFLLGRDDGISPCHALVVGAAVNQNSRREPITSVDPEAQTNLLRAACVDAGVAPNDLSAVEMHGTGTRIGDPVEVSALAQLLGSTGQQCYLTAAKMHMGHLESAAGALGLLKAILMVQESTVPRFTVAEVNPMVSDAMLGTCLRLPTSAPAHLPSEALVGVSSFGFAGNNAHAIVQGVAETRAMPRAQTPAGCACCTRPLAVVQPLLVATPVSHAHVAVLTPIEPIKLTAAASSVSVKALMLSALAEVGITVGEDVDPSTSVLDLGLDSLAMAELSSLLHIDMDDLFEDPSIASVLTLVAATGRAAALAATLSSTATLVPMAEVGAECTAISTRLRVFAALAEVGAEVDEDVDMTASVLALGLDSLAMAELSSLLSIDMDAIFEDPSIANVMALSSVVGVVSANVPHTSSTPLFVSALPKAVVVAPIITSGLSALPILPSKTKNSASWIRTTHVGSLPRAGRDETLGIRDIVRRQREAGFDVINDGEWSRSDYVSDSLSRIDGFSMGTDTYLHTQAKMIDIPTWTHT